MSQPATTLVSALNNFNPTKALKTLDELNSFFVKREHSPANKLKNYLFGMNEPVKVLFMGHRGSGKSSELNRLASTMHNRFVVVHFSVSEMLNSNDIKPVDVVLASAVAILRKIEEENLDVGDAVKEVELFLRNEIAKETTTTQTVSAEASAEVPFKKFLSTLSLKFSRESQTRKTVRQKLESEISNLFEKVNFILAEVSRLHKPVLLIVEGLDKTGLEDAKNIFFINGHLIGQLECHAIYTFQIGLRYDKDFSQIRQNFSKDFKLPNISICHRLSSSEPDELGRAHLLEMVERRMRTDLFEPDALNGVIELSGGLISDLMRLVQAGILAAMDKQDFEGNHSVKITLPMIEEAAAAIRSDFRAQLDREHYETLREMADRHLMVSNDQTRDVLFNQALLEYQNSEDWCSPHPIVKPLLEDVSIETGR